MYHAPSTMPHECKVNEIETELIFSGLCLSGYIYYSMKTDNNIILPNLVEHLPAGINNIKGTKIEVLNPGCDICK